MVSDEWEFVGLVKLVAGVNARILIFLFNLVLIHVQYVVLCVSVVIRVIRQILIHLILLLSFIDDQLRYLEPLLIDVVDVVDLQHIQVREVPVPIHPPLSHRVQTPRSPQRTDAVRRWGPRDRVQTEFTQLL